MNQTEYKSYQRGRRQLTADVDFSKGMQSNDSLVDEGYMKMLVNYDIEPNKAMLIPRPGVRFSEMIVPERDDDVSISFLDLHTEESVNVLDVKECIEKDEHYTQFILGNPYKLWVATCKRGMYKIESTNAFDLSTYKLHDLTGVPIPNTTPVRESVHGMAANTDCTEYATPAGAFAFGNSYYFIGQPSLGQPYSFLHTVFSETEECYKVEAVSPKKVDPAEAVSYGYNMLLGEDAYSFANTALSGVLQFTGILPYSAKLNNRLLMTPKPNEDVVFKCYFKGQVGKQYKFTMEWRHVGEDNWTALQSLEQSPVYTIKASDDAGSVCLEHDSIVEETFEVTFKVPSKSILVRVQAYPAGSDIVEKAMTVGFDFAEESYGEANNVDPTVYNLAKCKGVESWQNRIVLYNSSEDPKILFISDLNDPSYFPYPNNISIYDEPIICVKAYLDSLLVFTTSKIHQVTLSSDGTSWNSTVIQSNLYIKEEDKHLIQVVKNMVFFKSGEQYFMEVPKAQSSTGKLILAPISSSISNFFKYFERNISEIVEETYAYSGALELVNYYNFLNYEDVCNNYILRLDDNSIINVMLLYNINSRAWRVYSFESKCTLIPLKQDATQRSELVGVGSSAKTQGMYALTYEVPSVEENVLRGVTNRIPIENIDFDFVSHGKYKISVKAYYTGSNEAYYSATFEPLSREPGRVSMQSERCTLNAVRDSETGLWTVELVSTYADFYVNSDLELYTLIDSGTYYQRVKAQGTLKGRVAYYFKSGLSTLLEEGATIQIESQRYTLEMSGPGTYKPVDSDAFIIRGVYGIVPGFPDPSNVTYAVIFKEPIKADARHGLSIIGLTFETYGVFGGSKCIQIYRYDNTLIEDLDYPLTQSELWTGSHDSGWDTKSLLTYYSSAEPNKYNNWQYFDTGFRKDNFSRNKRYREVQFQLNNIDGTDLNFGLDFQIDGKPRLSYYAYDIEHVVDANDPNYGLVYVQRNVDMNLNMLHMVTPGETVLGPGPDTWILEQSLFPELSMWKVRAIVSGKGMAPRIRFVSRNPHKYELLSINLVYRLLYAR